MNAPLRPAAWFAPQRFDLGQLFSLHQRSVLASLVRWGVAPSDAEDVCAEVFIVAMHRLPTFQGSSRISTWLLGIARNLASDHRRAARTRREVLVDVLPEQSAADGGHDRLERAQESLAVRRAVAGLKPAQREVVTGYVLEEQPMNVVAMKGRVPAQTAYARLYAAQHALRASLSLLREAA